MGLIASTITRIGVKPPRASPETGDNSVEAPKKQGPAPSAQGAPSPPGGSELPCPNAHEYTNGDHQLQGKSRLLLIRTSGTASPPCRPSTSTSPSCPPRVLICKLRVNGLLMSRSPSHGPPLATAAVRGQAQRPIDGLKPRPTTERLRHKIQDQRPRSPLRSSEKPYYLN